MTKEMWSILLVQPNVKKDPFLRVLWNLVNDLHSEKGC